MLDLARIAAMDGFLKLMNAILMLLHIVLPKGTWVRLLNMGVIGVLNVSFNTPVMVSVVVHWPISGTL